MPFMHSKPPLITILADAALAAAITQRQRKRPMQVSRIVAGALALAMTGAAYAQTIPSALSRALAGTPNVEAPYAFDIEVQHQDVSWRARFQHGTEPRLQLAEPQRQDLDETGRRVFDTYARALDGISWCASTNLARVEAVRVVREDEVSITYAFQPTAESVRSEQMRRYANRLRGEMTVTKEHPDVTLLRIFSPGQFSPMPFVTVHRFNFSMRCQTAPNGRQYAAVTTTEVELSAFGRDINQRTVQRVSNLH